MRTLPLYTLFCPRHTPETTALSSPYDLFRDTPGLSEWLTACGEPSDCLPTGSAPDYDKLAALCRALSLSPGYPLRRRILALLTDGFDWRESCSDPPRLWNYLAEKLSPGAPDGDVTLARLARRIGADTGTSDGRTLLILPEAYAFCRPDPYHAALFRDKDIDTLSVPERNLLFTQQVRETAERCLAESRSLELIGSISALEPLSGYLAGARRLPRLTCTVTDPTCGSASPVFPAGVRVGLCLYGYDTPAELEAKLIATAARTPLLALDCVRLFVRDATDLGQIPLWQNLLQHFLVEEA